MARVLNSDSDKDEARSRRIAAREQARIPRSLLTRTGLSRDRNEPAKARTLIAQCEYLGTWKSPKYLRHREAAGRGDPSPSKRSHGLPRYARNDESE